MPVKPWERKEPTKTIKTKWRSIVIKTFRMPDGSDAEFDTLFKEDQRYASVLALTKSNKVIVARQFRPGPEAIWDELPGGGVEKGEDPLIAAERELLEETGYKVGRITFLGSSKRDAYFNAQWFYFFAEDCVDQGDGQHLDTNEHVVVDTLPIDTLIANAKSGNMSDTQAVFLAYDKLRSLQKEG